tara:strand:+ start:34688 stop:35083 length:396 start_codon:yes stop_codon:yes gene_type:complete
MYNVNIRESRHDWSKQNLVTIVKNGKNYDEMTCSNCGIKGKRHGFTTVEVSETYNREKAFNCPEAPALKIAKKIRITFCNAQGPAFANVIPDSVHDVIDPPAEYKNHNKGVWVMGFGEPVKVLSNEYEEVD